MQQHIIYGDIGGTKTLLQAAQYNDGTINDHDVRHYQSNAYDNFSAILNDFLESSQITALPSSPVAACFAVAGPVVSQCAQLTNLPWKIDANEIAEKFSIPHVRLLNDFEAAALAVDILPCDDLVPLQVGCPQTQSTRVILGAGTGMGVAWLVWQDSGYQPISTEAGHVDFAPTDALQICLLEALQKKFQRVSVERLLSGAGLTYIFNFLQEHLKEFQNLTPVHLNDDDGAIITALAVEQKHPIATRALELFAEIYGAYAGNLALTGLCRSGVYLAGGIAPKIIDILRAGGFMRAFCNKGRFSDLMKTIPVGVISNPSIGLLGAKKSALQHIEKKFV